MAIETDTLPQVNSSFTPGEVGLSNTQLIDLFESQVMSRHLDFQSRVMKNKVKVFILLAVQDMKVTRLVH